MGKTSGGFSARELLKYWRDWGDFVDIDVHGCGLLKEVNTDHDAMLCSLPHELPSDAHQRSPDHFDPRALGEIRMRVAR